MKGGWSSSRNGPRGMSSSCRSFGSESVLSGLVHGYQALSAMLHTELRKSGHLLVLR